MNHGDQEFFARTEGRRLSKKASFRLLLLSFLCPSFWCILRQADVEASACLSDLDLLSLERTGKTKDDCTRDRSSCVWRDRLYFLDFVEAERYR